MADKDEVLPLHRPITTKSGEVLNQLPVKKGTILIASIAGYNRYAARMACLLVTEVLPVTRMSLDWTRVPTTLTGG